jgi:hypothetical protein
VDEKVAVVGLACLHGRWRTFADRLGPSGVLVDVKSAIEPAQVPARARYRSL